MENNIYVANNDIRGWMHENNRTRSRTRTRMTLYIRWVFVSELALLVIPAAAAAADPCVLYLSFYACIYVEFSLEYFIQQ